MRAMVNAPRRFADALATSDPLMTISDWQCAALFGGDEREPLRLELLTSESRVLADVCNGGFDQFFFNSFSDDCIGLVEGLGAIGAEETRGLVLEAMRWFPGGRPSTDRFTRQTQLEALRGTRGFSEALSGLNERFFPGSGLLEERLLAYVRAHPAAFVFRATAQA